MKTPANRNCSTAEPSNSISVSIALCLLTISVTLNVLAAHRISALRKTIARIEAQHTLQPGATVPEIVGLDSNGSTAALHYGEVNVPTVLYVFTPQCGWCKKNLPNLHALIDQAGTRYRVVGIALTRQDLDSYVKHENLNLPIYSDVRSDIRGVYQMSGTPETIVVSPVLAP
ncbi:MAG: redoxin domain-containing protein [Candidatus Sulfotelmatobacter sp.]